MHAQPIAMVGAEAGHHRPMLVVQRRKLESDLVAEEAESPAADHAGLADEAAVVVPQFKQRYAGQGPTGEDAQPTGAQIHDPTEAALERGLHHDPPGVAAIGGVLAGGSAGKSKDSAEE